MLCRQNLLRTLRRKISSTLHNGNKTPTEFHFTPFDDDEQGPRTILTRLSDELRQNRQIGIQTISKFGFRLCDGTFLYGPIAIFPKVALSWRVLTPEDIDDDSLGLFTMLEPKLDVLVVGTGDRKHVDSVRQRILPNLSKHKIGLEIMDSAEAADMFNLLNVEYRCVAAALYPPDELQVTTHDHELLMKQFGDPTKFDDHFIISATKDYFFDTAKAMRKWLNNPEDIRRLEDAVKDRDDLMRYLSETKDKTLEEEDANDEISAVCDSGERKKKIGPESGAKSVKGTIRDQ